MKDAAVTVPAYYNDSQRQATKDAGVVAFSTSSGLSRSRRPQLIAYGLDKKDKSTGEKDG